MHLGREPEIADAGNMGDEADTGRSPERPAAAAPGYYRSKPVGANDEAGAHLAHASIGLPQYRSRHYPILLEQGGYRHAFRDAGSRGAGR
jgi:hypothetical protein